jgi:hypothetical protein
MLIDRTAAVSIALAATVVLAAPARPQDMQSGPPKGKEVPALKVFDATGPHMGKEVDYASERKGKPTIYVLIQADKWDRPMARFLKELEKDVQKEGADAAIVAVWLTEDADKTKDYLPRAQQSLQFQRVTLTCYAGVAGPKGWDVNADAHLTAVVVAKGRVATTFGYQSINETNAPEVCEALRKAGKAK